MLITLGSRIEIFHSSRPSFGAQKHSSFFNTILDDDSWDLKGGMYTLPSPCLETVHARWPETWLLWASHTQSNSLNFLDSVFFDFFQWYLLGTGGNFPISLLGMAKSNSCTAITHCTSNLEEAFMHIREILWFFILSELNHGNGTKS